MSCKIVLRLDKIIKIGISSSAVPLITLCLKDYKTNRRCDIKNSDRACPVTVDACLDRHLTKSLINIFHLNVVLLPLIFQQNY